MNVLTWAIFGVIVGISTHLIDPQKKSGGLIGSIILGAIGSLAGGFISVSILRMDLKLFNVQVLIIALLISLITLFTVRQLASTKRI